MCDDCVGKVGVRVWNGVGSGAVNFGENKAVHFKFDIKSLVDVFLLK